LQDLIRIPEIKHIINTIGAQNVAIKIVGTGPTGVDETDLSLGKLTINLNPSTFTEAAFLGQDGQYRQPTVKKTIAHEIGHGWIELSKKFNFDSGTFSYGAVDLDPSNARTELFGKNVLSEVMAISFEAYVSTTYFGESAIAQRRSHIAGDLSVLGTSVVPNYKSNWLNLIEGSATNIPSSSSSLRGLDFGNLIRTQGGWDKGIKLVDRGGGLFTWLFIDPKTGQARPLNVRDVNLFGSIIELPADGKGNLFKFYDGTQTNGVTFQATTDGKLLVTQTGIDANGDYVVTRTDLVGNGLNDSTIRIQEVIGTGEILIQDGTKTLRLPAADAAAFKQTIVDYRKQNVIEPALTLRPLFDDSLSTDPKLRLTETYAENLSVSSTRGAPIPIVERGTSGKYIVTYALGIEFLRNFDPRNPNSLTRTTTDSLGRTVTTEFTETSSGLLVQSGPKVNQDLNVDVIHNLDGSIDISPRNNPLGKVDFSAAGGIIGQVFGNYIAGENRVTQVVASSALKTLGDAFGDTLDQLVFQGGTNASANLKEVVNALPVEFKNNLKNAGVGAISSYLSAEFVKALGVEGLAGEALNTVSGALLNQMVTNIVNFASNPTGKFDLFKDIGSENFNANLQNVGYSFAANKLADAIATFDTVGGAIGAQIGAAIGSLIPVPPGINIIVIAFFKLIGGLIGSIFGGIPASGATVGFNQETGEFQITDSFKRKGGSLTAAMQLAGNAADALNGIFTTIGGEVLNGTELKGATYGLRKLDAVIYTDGIYSDNYINFGNTKKKDDRAASNMLGYGIVNSLRNVVIAGGDVYSKRAFYNVISNVTTGKTSVAADGHTSLDFGLDAISGALSVARQYQGYLENPSAANAISSLFSDSVFTAETITKLATAKDLGLM
jgi:hypothetical protein